MMRTFIAIIAIVAVATMAQTSGAATVAASGATLDLAPDIDVTSAALGRPVLGTLFWDYSNGSSTPNPPNGQAPQADRQADDFVGNQRNNLPAYITVGPGADLEGVSGGWGYQQAIDDFGGPFETGALASTAGPELATLTVGDGAPDSLRIGLVLDNLDGTAFVGTDLTLDIGGNNASLDPSVNANQMGDIYWFDAGGLATGDVISLQSGNSPNGFGTLAGVVLSEVPEPASCILLGLALAGAAAARRRIS